MLFFLLPLIFNPFGLIASWLPALYLAIWPIIIQTMGRETLITHAIVLILFILTCDISRQLMFRLIGFDLISLPLGLAFLMSLTTEKGELLLSILRPLFAGLLTLIEPVFLFIEAYLFIDIIRRFNKWISAVANERDEEVHDLSTWEPPLARVSIVARIAVILITILSYLGVYFIIQESKLLLGTGDNVPINFNHAIASLVTLQLIALSATIYKDEGILSESALIALLASVPIFIASWSFYNFKETTSSSSNWSSYFPFSIFGSSGRSEQDVAGGGIEGKQVFFGQTEPLVLDFSRFYDQQSENDPTLRFQESLDQLGVTDLMSKQLLVSLFRRLIMIINSILGLSGAKLAKYYFGPDFWCFLLGRLVCLSWWTLIWFWDHNETGQYQSQSQSQFRAGSSSNLPQRRRLRLPRWLSAKSLVKVLLVLAYAQMLIQQMDNRDHLQEIDFKLEASSSRLSCCKSASEEQFGLNNGGQEPGSDISAWFNCMWTSAKACSASNQPRKLSPISFIANSAKDLSRQLSFSLAWLYKRFTNFDSILHYWFTAWLARWRSPIVQRLIQSIFIQLYYIKNVLMSYE